MKFLSAADVVAIHDAVIRPNELQGLAQNKSIDAIVGRIENRLAYGLISDSYELAASYACCIAVGHAFHDANKRTAFAAMDVCLTLNGIELDFDATPDEARIGDLIIRAAQGIVDELELADWLKSHVINLGSE